MLSRRIGPAPFVTVPLSVLAQADFEEDEQQGAAQADRDQHDEQHLAGQSADQDAARGAGDNQQGG